MDPKAALIAGKLSGTMRILVGMGRIDSLDRFQPFGVMATNAQVVHEEGLWVVHVHQVAIPYGDNSPRLITHVGGMIYRGWDVVKLPNVRHMYVGDHLNLTCTFLLPEET